MRTFFWIFFCIACCLCCESCKLQSLPLYLSSTTPLQLQGGSWLSETRFVSQRLDGSRGFRSSVLCALLDQGVCGSRAPCLSFYCAWAFFNSGVPPWPCMHACSCVRPTFDLSLLRSLAKSWRDWDGQKVAPRRAAPGLQASSLQHFVSDCSYPTSAPSFVPCPLVFRFLLKNFTHTTSKTILLYRSIK